MDYGLLPPETTSARIWAGPGAQPMLAAAAAWDAVAVQLAATAAEFSATTSALADVWRGPSADAMTATAARYRAWLTGATARAEATAAQARSAAAAFGAVLAATVPPELVAANRAQLAILSATNVLGANTAAIAATEAAYFEMWAQDAAAMYAYAAQSAQAATLQPFAALAGDLGDSATPLGQLDEYAQNFLSSGPYEIPLALVGLFTEFWTLAPVASELGTLATATADAAPLAVSAPTAAPGAVVRAQVNVGREIGRLRVPPSWARPPTAPAGPPTIRPLPVAEIPAASPLLLPAGVPLGGTPPKRERPQPEYGGVVRFTTRPPAGG